VHDQLNKIWAIMGTPTEATWPGVTKLPDYKPYHFRKTDTPKGLDSVSPMLHPSTMSGDLASLILRLLPAQRIKASDALQHAYFSTLPPAVYSISDGCA
jgi:hypothetical protein